MKAIAAVKTASAHYERLGKVVTGRPQIIGSGFCAHHFAEDSFEGEMDPLLVVDDFVMTSAAFEPHLHIGISVVTALFEDSTGRLSNRDTLGHNFDLNAGDLYWLTAGSGVVHEERPVEGARIHALQIFVDLPFRLREKPARAVHVHAAEVPVISGERHRIRVLLGSCGATIGANGAPEHVTMLDGFLADGGSFSHQLPAGHQAWVYVLADQLIVHCAGSQRVLEAGAATTVRSGTKTKIVLKAEGSVHFFLMAARPIGENAMRGLQANSSENSPGRLRVCCADPAT
jgi:redox-sensitive bicupin YhaK (pirin superfamily)